MNPFIIINKDGYRYEDLTEENKKVIDWLNNLLDDMDGFTADYELTLKDEDASMLEKIEAEIALNTMKEFKEYAEAQIADYQISLIENQPEEE